MLYIVIICYHMQLDQRSTGYYPESWTTGIIVPIYKKGDRKIPGNYRGITLTSTMSKLFTFILNKRFCDWLDDANILSGTQFAYRKRHNTTDAVFVLNSIVSLKVKPSIVCCAFIDFSKAFDLVARELLYRKLKNYGISKKFLTIVMNMYSKVKSKVRTNAGCSDTFNLTTGLMQGECLSPSLFSSFINDVDEAMDDVESMGVTIHGTPITVFKYADDIVLLADNEEGLQDGLQALHAYCVKNRLTVNTAKIKVMYFSKKGIKSPPTMTYNDEPLEYVQSFKYLGLNFNSKCSFVESLDKLCSQARKAQTVLDLHVMRHPTMSVEHALQLFDSLIKPIVMFDSEVWGVENCGEIDKYFGGFLKKLLRVKQSTNTSMIYAETGSFALSVSVKLSIVKYWLKVINSGDNQLIRIAYEGMRRDTSCTKCDNWAMKVKTILNEYGFGSAWLNQSVVDQNKFIVLFERKIKANFIQYCFADIEASTRCRTYKDIKSIHNIEPYLQRDIHSSIKSAFTKLRLSSHRFMVSRGRWMKPKVQYIDIKCTLCNDNDIQDEYHIVLKCAYYNEVGRKYIKPYYHRHPSMYKFQELMNKSNKRDAFRLMIFIKIVMKDYDSTM